MAVLATAMAGASCSGIIADRGDNPAPRPGDMGPDGPPPKPGDPPAPPPSACGSRATPVHTIMLTREQYINAANDLLGFDVRTLAAFSDVAGRKVARGVSLTALQVEERLSAAEAIAVAAASPANLATVVGCDLAKMGEPACAAQLVDRLGLRAYRRPLTAETRTALRKLFDAGHAAGGFPLGVEWLLAGILQSPDFMYQLAPRPTGAAARPGAVVPLDDHALASRLSFFLWNSAPDPELLAAAAAGDLRRPAGLEAQVRRMLGHARAARMREDYYGHFLKLDGLEQIARDAREYTPALAVDLRRSVIQAIHDLYRTDPKLERLLGGSTLFVNELLERVYGLPPGSSADLKPVVVNPDERHGILTHPALMALLADPDASDPIKRGVFVEEELLCQTIPDPVADIPDLPPLRQGISTRQRLEMHRSNPACSICHKLFDPIGMAFENYDPIGRYRKVDQGVPVDSSGEIRQGLDLDGTFADGMEIIRRLAGSKSVRDCMVRRWFEYAVSRDLEGSEECVVEPLRARFATSGDLVDLATSIAQSEPFRSQQVGQE